MFQQHARDALGQGPLLKTGAGFAAAVFALTGCSADEPPKPEQTSKPSLPSTPSDTPTQDPRQTAALAPEVLYSVTDGFNGNKIRPDLWQPYNGVGTNGGGQALVDNIEVSDRHINGEAPDGNGTLKLKGVGETIAGVSWGGDHTPDFANGNYRFRVRMNTGGGYVPTFLLWPDKDQAGIGKQEIDALEVLRADKQEGMATVHTKDGSQQSFKPERTSPGGSAWRSRHATSQCRFFITAPLPCNTSWTSASG